MSTDGCSAPSKGVITWEIRPSTATTPTRSLGEGIYVSPGVSRVVDPLVGKVNVTVLALRCTNCSILLY